MLGQRQQINEQIKNDWKRKTEEEGNLYNKYIQNSVNYEVRMKNIEIDRLSWQNRSEAATATTEEEEAGDAYQRNGLKQRSDSEDYSI